jgi:hypothetical protein
MGVRLARLAGAICSTRDFQLLEVTNMRLSADRSRPRFLSGHDRLVNPLSKPILSCSAPAIMQREVAVRQA